MLKTLQWLFPWQLLIKTEMQKALRMLAFTNPPSLLSCHDTPPIWHQLPISPTGAWLSPTTRLGYCHSLCLTSWEGDGTPLQYSCLENPMDRGAWLQSMGSQSVGHDWGTSLSLFTFIHWRRKWQPTPVFLPGESQGWGEPVGLPSMGSQSQTRLKWLSMPNFISLFLFSFWSQHNYSQGIFPWPLLSIFTALTVAVIAIKICSKLSVWLFH